MCHGTIETEVFSNSLVASRLGRKLACICGVPCGGKLLPEVFLEYSIWHNIFLYCGRMNVRGKLLVFVRQDQLGEKYLCKEGNSMDQYRSRPKLSENFERHWSIPISGEIHMDQSLVHTFSWGNSYEPTVLKVLPKFPLALVLVYGWLFPALSLARPQSPNGRRRHVRVGQSNVNLSNITRDTNTCQVTFAHLAWSVGKMGKGLFLLLYIPGWDQARLLTGLLAFEVVMDTTLHQNLNMFETKQ